MGAPGIVYLEGIGIISLISNVQNRSRIACAVAFAFPVPSHLRPLITPPPHPRRFSPPLTPLPPSPNPISPQRPLPIHHRRNTMETSSSASSRPLPSPLAARPSSPSLSSPPLHAGRDRPPLASNKLCASPLLPPLNHRRHRRPVRRPYAGQRRRAATPV